MNECRYFDYLLKLIDSPYVDDYKILLNILFSTDFRWSIHNDDNRAKDGIEIRYDFEEECGINDDDFMELMLIPCSVMEVICGLAIRMDLLMRDPEEPHIARWFWELVGNLGLLDYCDEAFERGVWNFTDVKNVLDIFMDRQYDELGHGGLFPRNSCDKNQTVTELYSQMNGYLMEKYVK